MKISFSRLLALAAVGLALGNTAHAVSFTLNNSTATIIGGNTTSTFYEVTGANAESGTAAPIFSSSIYNGPAAVSSNDPDRVEIFFNGPQPILTSAFIKASNEYMFWDATDLAAFNAGIFTSIILVQNGLTNGNGQYHDISHAGINGTPGNSNIPGVPDGGATLALLGLGVSFLIIARRKLV
ncbi:MAG: VPDSG-CTERM sorting domain-containing protein [Opitutaceae bacterium]